VKIQFCYLCNPFGDSKVRVLYTRVQVPFSNAYGAADAFEKRVDRWWDAARRTAPSEALRHGFMTSNFFWLALQARWQYGRLLFGSPETAG
jgi:hypothetical protein